MDRHWTPSTRFVEKHMHGPYRATSLAGPFLPVLLRAFHWRTVPCHNATRKTLAPLGPIGPWACGHMGPQTNVPMGCWHSRHSRHSTARCGHVTSPRGKARQITLCHGTVRLGTRHGASLIWGDEIAKNLHPQRDHGPRSPLRKQKEELT